jgi:hypothetical protein
MNFAVAELVVTLCTAIAALIVATATVVWFVSEQFKKSRNEMWKAISSLHNTVMAHIDDINKENNRRFQDLTTQVWKMEVRASRWRGDVEPERPNGEG